MRAILPLILALVALPAAHAAVVHDYYGSYGGDDWIDWRDDFRNDPYTVVRLPPPRTFGGCYIAVGGGELLDDLDCDDVPDVEDNCLGLANPAQFDQNRNGLGDACDVVVERIELDPDEVASGRSFLTTATITNYRPYEVRNMELKVQVPALGLEERVYVDRLGAGDQGRYEFFLRIPQCADVKTYDLVLMVEVPTTPGLTEFFHVPTSVRVATSTCQPEEPEMSDSIITILDVQDVDENGGVYPFTIVNQEAEAQAYVLTVEGTEGWGSYQVEPRSLIIVPAGEARQGELVLYADEGVEGVHGFVFTARSRKDAQQVLMTAHVEERPPAAQASQNLVLLGILAGGAVLLLVMFALLVGNKPRK